MTRRRLVFIALAFALTLTASAAFAQQLAAGVHVVGGFLGFGTDQPQRTIHISRNAVGRIRIDGPHRNWEFGVDGSPDSFFIGETTGRRPLQVHGSGDVEVASGALIVGGREVIDANGDLTGVPAAFLTSGRNGNCSQACGGSNKVLHECQGRRSSSCSAKYGGQTVGFTCGGRCDNYVCLCAL